MENKGVTFTTKEKKIKLGKKKRNNYTAIIVRRRGTSSQSVPNIGQLPTTQLKMYQVKLEEMYMMKRYLIIMDNM